eukprot:1494-Heterococcus_DN1.PRE.4
MMVYNLRIGESQQVLAVAQLRGGACCQLPPLSTTAADDMPDLQICATACICSVPVSLGDAVASSHSYVLCEVRKRSHSRVINYCQRFWQAIVDICTLSKKLVECWAATVELATAGTVEQTFAVL